MPKNGFCRRYYIIIFETVFACFTETVSMRHMIGIFRITP
jgi:hypothetical protein